MSKGIKDALRRIRQRRLVANFCRRLGKSRSWFYSAEAAALAPYAAEMEATLAPSAHPVTAAREALGLSQSALAEALGVSRQTIHAWETQHARQDRLDRIRALHKA